MCPSARKYAGAGAGMRYTATRWSLRDNRPRHAHRRANAKPLNQDTAGGHRLSEGHAEWGE